MEGNQRLEKHEPPLARRFVLVWLAVVLVVGGILFPAVTMFLLNWSNDSNTRWIYELRRRKQKMVELEKGSGRLLIAGGSSGLFSIDAELLTAKLGRPVLNLSTHGGLGRRFFLQDLQDRARPGDTVLIFFEYSAYRATDGGINDVERKFLWTHEPMRILRLGLPLALEQLYGNPFSDYRDSWIRWNARLSGSTMPGTPSIWPGYSFVELSPNGDLRQPLGWKGTIKQLSIEPNLELAKEPQEKFKEFFGWAKRNGVALIEVLPSVARSEGAAEENLRAYGRKIENFYRENGVKVVSVPELQQLPKEFYLDTEYHASSAGRRILTERLVPELQNVLGIAAKDGGEPFTYLVHSPTARYQTDLAFANNPQVKCKYLSKEDLRHPLSLTIADAREAVKEGKRFLFSDPDVAEILEQAGVPTRTVERKKADVRAWLERYPQHVFAIVAIGEEGKRLAIDGVQKPFDEVLSKSGSYRAAWVGTGKYSKVRKIMVGAEPVELRRSTSANWAAKNGIPMSIEIHSAAAYSWEKGDAPLFLERHRIFDKSENGLGIAVIEPERGILVDRRVLSSRDFVEYNLAEIVGQAN